MKSSITQDFSSVYFTCANINSNTIFKIPSISFLGVVMNIKLNFFSTTPYFLWKIHSPAHFVKYLPWTARESQLLCEVSFTFLEYRAQILLTKQKSFMYQLNIF